MNIHTIEFLFAMNAPPRKKVTATYWTINRPTDQPIKQLMQT